ncbi:hypothetical protein [Rhizobium oryziradicis]|uniref:hypothetical protein n=1 Tax=Rhizobium oryziradicis TaxID=1867956 RepID=UPI0015880928|nr:hypothetical protein [Rhizobium oryziradicis]
MMFVPYISPSRQALHDHLHRRIAFILTGDRIWTVTNSPDLKSLQRLSPYMAHKGSL